MHFDPRAYGAEVAAILALDGNGQRLMPLAMGRCSSEEARRRIQNAADLFPHARSPEAARSGLYLYFSCLDEAHTAAQNLSTPEGSYWHGIMHRQEPDPGNAACWFRRVGAHPIFPALRTAAGELAAARQAGDTLPRGPDWDPFAFIDLCARAGRERGALEDLALEIQRAEWQLLFDYCAQEPA